MLLSVMILLDVIQGLGTGDIFRRHLQLPAVREMCGKRELACANAVNMTRICTIRRLNGETQYRDYRNPCHLFLSNMCDQPGEEFFIAWDSSCATYRRTNRNDNFNEIDNNSIGISNNTKRKKTKVRNTPSDDNINKSVKIASISRRNSNKSEDNIIIKSDKNISLPQISQIFKYLKNILQKSNIDSQENINMSAENVSYKDSNNDSDKSNNDSEASVNISQENITNYRTEIQNSDKNINDSKENDNSTEINEDEVNTNDNGTESSNENRNSTEYTNSEDANSEDTNTVDTSTVNNDIAIEISGDAEIGINNALRENFVTPKYETDTSFDDLPCRYFCPDVYSPMCLIANKKHMKYMKVFSFANYCLASIYFCKYQSQFKPPPKEEYEDDDGYYDVRSSPISMSFCGASRYLQFSRFSQAASAMGHYGWLNGDYRYSHILEPHERRPGYG